MHFYLYTYYLAYSISKLYWSKNKTLSLKNYLNFIVLDPFQSLFIRITSIKQTVCPNIKIIPMLWKVVVITIHFCYFYILKVLEYTLNYTYIIKFTYLKGLTQTDFFYLNYYWCKCGHPTVNIYYSNIFWLNNYNFNKNTFYYWYYLYKNIYIQTVFKAGFMYTNLYVHSYNLNIQIFKVFNLFLSNYFKILLLKKHNLILIRAHVNLKKLYIFIRYYFYINLKYKQVFNFYQYSKRSFYYQYIQFLTYKDLASFKKYLRKIFAVITLKNQRRFFFFLRFNLQFVFAPIYKLLNLIGLKVSIKGKYATFVGGRKKKFVIQFFRNSLNQYNYIYKFYNLNFSTKLGTANIQLTYLYL